MGAVLYRVGTIKASELGGLYKSMGEYVRAEPLYRQALEVQVVSFDAQRQRIGLARAFLADEALRVTKVSSAGSGLMIMGMLDNAELNLITLLQAPEPDPDIEPDDPAGSDTRRNNDYYEKLVRKLHAERENIENSFYEGQTAIHLSSSDKNNISSNNINFFDRSSTFFLQ